MAKLKYAHAKPRRSKRRAVAVAAPSPEMASAHPVEAIDVSAIGNILPLNISVLADGSVARLTAQHGFFDDLYARKCAGIKVYINGIPGILLTPIKDSKSVNSIFQLEVKEEGIMISTNDNEISKEEAPQSIGRLFDVYEAKLKSGNLKFPTEKETNSRLKKIGSKLKKIKSNLKL